MTAYFFSMFSAIVVYYNLNHEIQTKLSTRDIDISQNHLHIQTSYVRVTKILLLVWVNQVSC